MFRGNPAHTGEYPGPRATNGELKWEFKTIGEVISSPSVVNGVVFVLDDKKNIYAIHCQSGSLKWKKKVEGLDINIGDEYTPAVANGKVFAGAYVLDAETGDIIADFYSILKDLASFRESHSLCNPTIIDTTLYLKDYEVLYAIDTGSLTMKWKLDLQDLEEYADFSFSDFVTPAVVDGVVYCTAGKQIFALDAESGALIWSSKLKDNLHFTFGSCIALSNGIIYAYISEKNDSNLRITQFFAFDVASGSVIWNIDFSDDVSIRDFAVANGIVYVSLSLEDYNGHWPDYNGLLRAFDAESGALIWKSGDNNAIDDFTCGTLSVADGMVYAISWHDKIYSLNADSGELIWEFDHNTYAGRVSRPAVLDGIVYVGVGTNSLYALK